MTNKKVKKKEEVDNNASYSIEMPKCQNSWRNRVLVFTPHIGLVRTEWVQGRFGQIIPTNWSMVEMNQFLSPYMPQDYQLADAQNLMAKKVVEDGYRWIIYIESDNVLPPHAFWIFNQYMNEADTPVVSGLYFTKTEPPEPMIYRGRGESFYRDWKLGDKVWADGIPFGCRLESGDLIRAAWEESEEYWVNGELTRRVFEQPNRMFFDEEKGGMSIMGGTTDLAWCTRLMEEGLFEKAGWGEYQKMKNPYLVDTRIYVKHIDQNGRKYPLEFPKENLPDDPEKIKKYLW